MKKRLLLFVAMLGIVTLVNAQWTTQTFSFSTASVYLDDVSAVDNDVVWATGADGSGGGLQITEFAKTTDGGMTWTTADFGMAVGDEPMNIHALSADRAFCIAYGTTGSNGASFWETSDGGSTWTPVDILFGLGSSFANGVVFWDDNLHGFVHGDYDSNDEFEIYYTADGGDTWTLSATRPKVIAADEYSVNALYCMTVYGTTGYIITNYGRVLKTTDYGVNWEMTASDPFTTATSFGSMKIYTSDGDHILCQVYDTGAGTWGDFMYSDNGGLVWLPHVPIGPFHPSGWMTRANNSTTLISTGVESGVDEGVSMSTDGGVNWTDIGPAPGDSQRLLGVGFSSVNIGWVSSWDEIYRWDNPNPISINEVEANTLFNIYPNPSTGIINISLSNEESANVEVLDILGKVVTSLNNVSSDVVIDLTNQAKGLYFVNIDSGNANETHKVIVK